LNASTGVISGTPSTQTIGASYVVTATNLYGSTSSVLNIEVIGPVSGLSYALNPARYEAGLPITQNTPTVIGSVTGYTVSPPLPAGLTLNPASGSISGTPTVPSAAANYSVTASNGAGGSATTAISIAILLKPANLSYATNPGNYTVDVPILPNTPSLQGSAPLTYTVSPSLPAGLSLSPTSGVISGTPTTATVTTFYTITATNEVGAAVAVLIITTEPSVGVTWAAPKGRILGFQPIGSPRLSFDVPRGEIHAVQVEILDMHGRRIWEEVAAPAANLSWNGISSEGTSAPAGTYLVRLTWRDEKGNTAKVISRQFTHL
jgi:hypothetical protein